MYKNEEIFHQEIRIKFPWNGMKFTDEFDEVARLSEIGRSRGKHGGGPLFAMWCAFDPSFGPPHYHLSWQYRCAGIGIRTFRRERTERIYNNKQPPCSVARNRHPGFPTMRVGSWVKVPTTCPNAMRFYSTRHKL